MNASFEELSFEERLNSKTFLKFATFAQNNKPIIRLVPVFSEVIKDIPSNIQILLKKNSKSYAYLLYLNRLSKSS